MNGGYVMLDFDGHVLGVASHKEGIYKKCSDAIKSGKPILISNVSVTLMSGDTYKYTPLFACNDFIEGNEDILFMTSPAQANFSISANDIISSFG